MPNPTSPQPAKRSTWRRKLLVIFGSLLVLLVVAYFVVTSSAFLKGVILPRAGKAIGGQITVADISLSPFSEVHIHQLKVQTTGTEPLLQAEDVRLRYSLFSILRGTIKVDEITLDTPVVQIIQNADGTSNLDPLTQKSGQPESKPSPSSGKPPQIDLKNFNLKNATIRHVNILKDGGRQTAELSGVNITLDQLKNGQAGKLTTAANFKLTLSTNDTLEAKSASHLDFTLGPDLLPTSFQLKVEQDILNATGSLSQMAGHRTVITGDVTPTDIKEFSQQFFQGDKLLGEIKASGPLDLAKKEGHIKLEVASIDRQVLNLIGAPLGIDFGTTTLDFTTDVSLTQGGSVIVASTQFKAAKFSLTQNGQTTPPLDLQVAYNVTVNSSDKTAVLQSFTLDGTQNQNQILHGSLTQPMTFAWGNTSPPPDAAFDLTVTNFNFADWKAMLGDSVSAGKFSMNLNVLSQQGGKQLKLGLTSQIDDLSMRLGATPLTQAALALKLDTQVNDFKKINLSEYRLDLTQQSQPALTVSGSAAYDGAAFNLQTKIEAVMARLLGSGPATPLAVNVKLDGAFANQALDLRQLQLALSPTQLAPKNELNITGHLDLSTPTTKGNLSIKADTFDVTQLYDAFSGEKSSSPASAGTPAPAASSSPGNVEPDPVVLPLQFTADANLGQVYLHDIAITNLQTTVKVDGGKITLDPCQLALNGAPINASVNLDLSVKGWTYALSLLMDKVPLQPIADTFSPTTRGQYQGLILANAKIKGAGVTGTSLQKNLSGQATFSFTNANLQVMGPKTKNIIVPIATLLNVNEISKSPLDWLDAHMELGGGNINLTEVTMQSAAFQARTKGVIPIADVLTNSPLNLPVEFAISRSLGQSSGLLQSNTATNAPYGALPNFITVKGTLGDPKSDLNKLALGSLLLKSGAGVVGKLGGNLGGNALGGVGNLLPGNTNQAGTNSVLKKNPLGGLFK